MKLLLSGALTSIFLMLTSCDLYHSRSIPTDCNELVLEKRNQGWCESYGIAFVSSDFAVQYIQFPSGARGGVALSLYPEIENGDRVYVKGRFYANGPHLEFEEITTLKVVP